MRALPGKSSRFPPGSQPVSRQSAPADQRRRILRAAAELIAEHGFRGTSAEMIIRRAKVGYGTFYKHFDDKEACLLSLFEACADRSLKHLSAVYENQDAGWPQKIAAVVAALFEEIGSDPVIARVCIVESLTAGEAAVASYDRALKRAEPLLEPGRALSPHGDRLPQTLEGTVASGVVWIAYQQLRRGEPERLAALLPEAIEFALRPYVGEQLAAETADEAAGSLAAAPA